jgi:hypothetical protein
VKTPTKADLQTTIAQLKANIEVWRTVAAWTDEELTAHFEWLNKREYIKLPNPLPTTRTELIDLLASIAELDQEEEAQTP